MSKRYEPLLLNAVRYSAILHQLEERKDIKKGVPGLFPPYERGNDLMTEYQRWLDVGIAAARREMRHF